MPAIPDSRPEVGIWDNIPVQITAGQRTILSMREGILMGILYFCDVKVMKIFVLYESF